LRILVADDDQHIRELAGLYLEREGYSVDYARDGKEALAEFRRRKPDLVVLDLMMPAMDGVEVCRILRKESEVPILMLTARNEEIDKVVGLEMGADDYLTKPFSPRELTARVKAVLRRYTGGVSRRAVINLADVQIDKQKREVTIADSPVTMRTKEFDLLTTFAENFEVVLTREQLLDVVWGYEFYGETRTVDVHVQHVRQKIAGSGLQVQTIRGVGYKLTAQSIDGSDRPGTSE
jgi:two-component system, OmpR family, alkaline phosphatase synthesis response regulator PhoP